MEIKLDSTAIDNFVRDAVVQSLLGKNLEEAINKCLQKIFDSYDSPFEETVRKFMSECITEQLLTHKAEIMEKIAGKVPPNVIEQIVGMGVNQFMETVKRAQYY